MVSRERGRLTLPELLESMVGDLMLRGTVDVVVVVVRDFDGLFVDVREGVVGGRFG